VPVIRIDTNQGVYGPGECVTSRTMTSIVGSGVSPACVTNTSVSSWCCTRDGRRPPEVGLQEQTSNCLSAAAFKRCGGERLEEKASTLGVRWVLRR
jgi:hypothetical protein